MQEVAFSDLIKDIGPGRVEGSELVHMIVVALIPVWRTLSFSHSFPSLSKVSFVL